MKSRFPDRATVIRSTQSFTDEPKTENDDTEVQKLKVIEILGSAFIVEKWYEREDYLTMLDFAIKRCAHRMSRAQRKAWARTGYKRDEKTLEAILSLSA